MTNALSITLRRIHTLHITTVKARERPQEERVRDSLLPIHCAPTGAWRVPHGCSAGLDTVRGGEKRQTTRKRWRRLWWWDAVAQRTGQATQHGGA